MSATPNNTTDDNPLILTSEEIVALCDGLQLTPPSEYAAALPAGDLVAPVLATARRGLVARHLVGYVDGKAVVADWLGAIIEVIARPALLIRIDRVKSQELFSCDICASPTLAVQQEHSPVGVHALRTLEVGALFGRTVAFASVEDRPLHDAPTFTVGTAVVADACALALAGKTGEAEMLLRTNAVPAATASGFIAAAATPVQTVAIGVLYRPEADRWASSVLNWVDGGPNGLWQMTPDDPPTSVTIAPVTAVQILETLRKAFP